VHSISFGRPKLLMKKLEKVNELVLDKFLHKGRASTFRNYVLLRSLS